jgi:hypothetical protein
MTAPERIVTFLLAAAPLAGCGLLDAWTPAPPPWAEVQARRGEAPAQPLRRVLVLPFVSQDAAPGHAEAMRTSFAQALRERCGFDVVAPDLALLPRTTRDELAAGAARDPAALIRIHREWGADAILYGRLAYSRPHGEPGIGLEIALVDARDGATLWSAQDAVDAREPGVRASLLEFRREEEGGEPSDATQVPYESFTRFVARSFVRTLYAPSKEAPTAPADAGAPAAVTTARIDGA